jgi:hypothetical protein
MPFSGSVPTNFDLSRSGDLVYLNVIQAGTTVTTVIVDGPTAVRIGTRLAQMGDRVVNHREEPTVEDAWAL